MCVIEVNGKSIEATEGEMLLPVLQRAGVHVPTLCNMEDLLPSGACRLCVVELDGRPNLAPSCATPVCSGMKVMTHSPRAVRARKTIIELLLANHPDDCLYCIRNNECDLQDLAAQLGVRQRRYAGNRRQTPVDVASMALVRDQDKCVLCGKCVRVCEEVQGVAAIDFVGRGSETAIDTAFGEGLNLSSCVYCGQCVIACPTGALREQSHIKQVAEALHDPEKVVAAQIAPSVSVTLGEEFGLKPGTDVAGLMNAALRRLGFDYVFDTSFAADLTIMEEASEFVHRIKTGGTLPLFTSCSPGWVKFVEEFYPDFLPNLSSCKSPQQMLGAVIKTWFAQREEIPPASLYSVSVMPCTAKKFEATRSEMGRNGMQDVDAVLTTRELARMIQLHGIDFNMLEPALADDPFGVRSSAGKLFGASGGVMEAALRTAYHLITGDELEQLKVEAVRGLKEVKMARITIGDLEIGVAAVNGLIHARRLLEEIRGGRDDLHFIEVMTCPGGCIAGGGQPQTSDVKVLKARMQALYSIDEQETLRTSHGNPSVQRIYDEFLEKPLGERSHELLHTHY
ncbi:MAG: [FeFe] hydrogenase, group A, partial [Candidatus Hydrogenedentes bacterium]|nr:[FeFe] hydrogenase, group A [Candidatus Hydrogenedentota bacterium]